jgi:large subunit ribosomal protein L19
MAVNVMEKLIQENVKEDRKALFAIGDQVKVHVKIQEGGKDRVQVFNGTVIARRGTGVTASFTVRRISHGVGVERVFPIHSPYIDKIEVEGSAHVRRAKLLFLRERTGKRARLKEKINK